MVPISHKLQTIFVFDFEFCVCSHRRRCADDKYDDSIETKLDEVMRSIYSLFPSR